MPLAAQSATSTSPSEEPTPTEGPDIPRGALGHVRAVAGALLTPTGLVGAALEASWLGFHLGLYPLGLVGARASHRRAGYRVDHLSPVQRGLSVCDLDAAQTPILLIHGLVDNRSIFTVLRRRLVSRGFGRIESINYPLSTQDVRTAAAQLAAEVERLVEETGHERIHIIGHSLGGLIARYYVTRLGGDLRVHTLVTLGTPHGGSYLAYAWNSPLTRQLRPGSKLLAELAQPVRECQTRFISYWSDLDQVVLPQRNAALRHPDLNVHNIGLHGVGHGSLPFTRSVVHGISRALAHLDSSGATVTPGVSEVTRRRVRPL